MVPDFGWVSPWELSRPETHSAKALLTFCLPVGVVAYWMFQYTMKTPLVELLPPGAYAHFRDFAVPARMTDLKQWILAAGGVLFGAMTHLIWDAFTHEGARGLRMIPELSHPAVRIGGRHLAGAQLLEDASSVIGLLIVLGVVAYALRPSPQVDANPPRRLSRSERRTWRAAYLLVAAALSGIFFLIQRHGARELPGVYLHVSDSAISILRGVLATLLLVSVALESHLRMRPGRRR
jgi:hypothetical protein